MRTRVKICGVTRPQDAQAAAAAGADAVGFVFYPPAAVAIDAAAAAVIAADLPPFVATVALFVNAAAAEVQRVIDVLQPDYLQFHGDEDADFCSRFARPYIKVCRVRGGDDVARAGAAHPACRALLLDRYEKDQPGGTGRAFDWAHIPAQSSHPLIIAGGLTAPTVGELLRQVRPWGVDVSSGVAEKDDRRRKDCGKIYAFMQSVRDADCASHR